MTSGQLSVTSLLVIKSQKDNLQNVVISIYLWCGMTKRCKMHPKTSFFQSTPSVTKFLWAKSVLYTNFNAELLKLLHVWLIYESSPLRKQVFFRKIRL